MNMPGNVTAKICSSHHVWVHHQSGIVELLHCSSNLLVKHTEHSEAWLGTGGSSQASLLSRPVTHTIKLPLSSLQRTSRTGSNTTGVVTVGNCTWALRWSYPLLQALNHGESLNNKTLLDCWTCTGTVNHHYCCAVTVHRGYLHMLCTVPLVSPVQHVYPCVTVSTDITVRGGAAQHNKSTSTPF